MGKAERLTLPAARCVLNFSCGFFISGYHTLARAPFVALWP